VQSANNVLILCLARIGESNHVIQNAVPGLRQTIQRLSALGTSVVLAGGVELKFRVEFHIAADLKALWLCLGLKNFVCPFCTQTSFNEDLHGTFDARELSGCLGVPSNRVHLCSLHATLRIVERLVKNAASFVYQHNEVRVRNQKFKALSGLIESKLKRKKFNITVGSLKEAKVEEALPADEVFIDNDASLGTNLGAMFQNNVHVKLSALTGSQAIKILEKEDIYMGIIDITEGEPLLTPTDHLTVQSPEPCTCAIMWRTALAAGQLLAQAKRQVCRRCMVKRVWAVFATQIFPLVRSLSTPQRILDAMAQGEDAVKSELDKIQALALDWLTSYVRVYGSTVTPYVHVIGRHLHHMLSRDGGYTIGTWSQQGFEACHKLVRKVLNRKTSQGGGRGRVEDGESPISPLLQVLQHVYRTKWGTLRHMVTRPPRGLDPNNPLYEAVLPDLQARFEAVDSAYAEKYPDRDVKAYITRSCKSSLKQAWKRIDETEE
jgi:hypothetical protein